MTTHTREIPRARRVVAVDGLAHARGVAVDGLARACCPVVYGLARARGVAAESLTRPRGVVADSLPSRVSESSSFPQPLLHRRWWGWVGARRWAVGTVLRAVPR